MPRCLIADLHNTVLARLHGTRQVYSPYGASRESIRPCLAFSAQLREPWADGYLLGNGKRLYMPSIARFGMPDRQSPFGRGGLSAYAYCLGDPVNRVDPSGEISFFALAKNVVWLASRVKAVLGKAAGVKRVGEAAKWGTVAGSAMATFGIPGGALIANASKGIALSVKAFTVTKALAERAQRVIAKKNGFSPFVGSLPSPIDHVNGLRQSPPAYNR
jgi:RHS repeat-associated protein